MGSVSKCVCRWRTILRAASLLSSLTDGCEQGGVETVHNREREQCTRGWMSALEGGDGEQSRVLTLCGRHGGGMKKWLVKQPYWNDIIEIRPCVFPQHAALLLVSNTTARLGDMAAAVPSPSPDALRHRRSRGRSAITVRLFPVLLLSWVVATLATMHA